LGRIQGIGEDKKKQVPSREKNNGRKRKKNTAGEPSPDALGNTQLGYEKSKGKCRPTESLGLHNPWDNSG